MCKNPIKRHVCKKDQILNSSTCVCEINTFLKRVADDLVIACDEIKDAVAKLYYKPTKTTPINFHEKKATWKIEISYIWLFINYHITINNR